MKTTSKFRKEEENISLFHCASIAKKYIKGCHSPSFDNPIFKKLKTYTKHSHLTKTKYKEIKKF